MLSAGFPDLEESGPRCPVNSHRGTASCNLIVQKKPLRLRAQARAPVR